MLVGAGQGGIQHKWRAAVARSAPAVSVRAEERGGRGGRSGYLPYLLLAKPAAYFGLPSMNELLG